MIVTKNIRFAVLLTFVLFGCKSEQIDEQPIRLGPVVKFEQPLNNTSIQRGQIFTALVRISDLSEVNSLSVYNKDSVFFNGIPDQSQLKFEFNTKTWRVGTNQLTVETILKDGKSVRDNRVIRILSDVYPIDYTPRIVNVYPHLTSSYTQGLEFDGNQLYEGTGGTGATGVSMLAKVDFKTGKVLNKFELGPEYFGEGITILDDNIYQLTWQQNKAFVYNKNLERINDFTFQGEGWGLTNDGSHLIMSDGSERLYFRDPTTFGVVKTIEVYSNLGPVRNLNELEYVDGLIYANVYQTNNIIMINPETGIVVGVVDCSELALDYRKGADVFNGIAYHSGRGTFFVTGKNWSSLIEVQLEKL
jgi:glutaminyl-peptide cyclotransferase